MAMSEKARLRQLAQAEHIKNCTVRYEQECKECSKWRKLTEEELAKLNKKLLKFTKVLSF